MEDKILFEANYLESKNAKISYIISIIICAIFLALLCYFEGVIIINVPEIFFLPMIPGVLIIIRLFYTIFLYRRKLIIKENTIFIREAFSKGCTYNCNINDYSILITQNRILNFIDKKNNNLVCKCVLGYEALERLKLVKEINIISNNSIESYFNDNMEINYMNDNDDNTALLLKCKYNNDLKFNIDKAKNISCYYEPIGVFNMEILLENEIIELSFFQIHISWEIKDKEYNTLLEDCRTIGNLTFEEIIILINRIINKEELEFEKYYPFEF